MPWIRIGKTYHERLRHCPLHRRRRMDALPAIGSCLRRPRDHLRWFRIAGSLLCDPAIDGGMERGKDRLRPGNGAGHGRHGDRHHARRRTGRPLRATQRACGQRFPVRADHYLVGLRSIRSATHHPPVSSGLRTGWSAAECDRDGSGVHAVAAARGRRDSHHRLCSAGRHDRRAAGIDDPARLGLARPVPCGGPSADPAGALLSCLAA